MRYKVMILLLLSSFPSISQNCDVSLSGKVIDIHDGSILPGATLVISNTQEAVQTNLYGEYTFSNLCEGTYFIQVSHPLCLTRGFTVKISGDTTRDFKLEHHLEELNQILIEGKTFQNETESIFQNRISRAALDRYSSGSLGDALNSISGVSSLNTGNTVVKPVINGLHSSRVVIINNGVRMEDQEWGAEHAPNIDINSAGSISVIKGAGALQYGGNAVGGVIVANSKKAPVKDTLYGQTQFNAATNGRGSSFTSEITKAYKTGWYGSLQGTLKRFGDFQTPDYVLSNTGIFERNASIRFGLNQFDYGFEGYYSIFKNKIGILRASHIGGAQDQVRAINSSRPLIIGEFGYTIEPPKQDVTHHLARVKAFKEFNGLGKASLQYDFQRNNRLEFDIRRGSDANKASLDLALTTHTLLLDLDSEVSENLNLKTGIMARYQDNFADPETGVRRLIPDYEKYELGAYAIVDFKIRENWTVEAGGRFDYTYMDVFKFYRSSFWESRNYDELFPEIVVEESGNQLLTNPQLNFYNASATAGSTYSFDGEYKLFFNYSLASRAPNPSELFSEGLHHSASRIELGDLSFQSEISHKLALTFQRENSTFGFSINPYIHSIKDFIVIEPIEIQQTIRGNFQVWEYRQTNASLLGVDVDASLAFAKNLRFNHQFSLVKGYDRSRNQELIDMPPVNTKNELVYQNPKIYNLRLALQSEYVFRQNEFPNNNFEVFLPETETTELIDVSTPPNAYNLLNFNSNIDLNTTSKSKLTLGLTVSNLLNTSYRNYLNRLRFYADDLGRNFLLNLKLNY
ncbi:TonB-dependent receptor [Gillisia limnaea]|uniref:TonB-dependent receptor plug n=1 Tax=Gillisia limnaea (strain DSM 15749 / LMG 21470 / R-8282) TaxID=865937 RepID=H2BTQ6_GILLR|nr:TonB-dependent receptor [Gillisia limnaea]EHQ02676.1 TonB-dependent receptor plug [Gillisia limnaea DSM 15749]